MSAYKPAVWFKNVDDLEEYLVDHLLSGDYHIEGTVRGHDHLPTHGVFGDLCRELLGPAGLTPDAFRKLGQGIHPLTGKPLFQRARKDRRAAFDVTCSPHKSVSIACRVAGDKRIMEAVLKAANESREFLISQAAIRVQDGTWGACRKVPGQVIGASYLHAEARPVDGAIDPNLHVHNIFWNMSRDPVTGEWFALENGLMFKDGALERAGVHFNNVLAVELRRLGWEIDVDTKGEVSIRGISTALCEEFSKRGQLIKAEIARREEELERELTWKEKKGIVVGSRESKWVRDGKPFTPEEIRQGQLERLTPEQRGDLERLYTMATTGGPLEPYAQVRPLHALQLGIAHFTERNSVFSEHELVAWILANSIGRVEADHLKEEIMIMKETGQLLSYKGHSLMTTLEMLKIENSMIALAREGLGAMLAPISLSTPIPTRDVGGRFDLTAEQRDAVRHLWQSTDFAVVLRGLAGTGKSSALLTAVDGLTKAGVTVHLFAPSATAVQDLRGESLAPGDPFARTGTMQGLLKNKKAQEALGEGDYVILDEAGLVGARDMEQLLALCKEKGCRIALVGDIRQHTSVPAGDALRILEQESGIRISELQKINRQQTEELREAAQLAAAHQPVKALAIYKKLGRVIEEQNNEARYTALSKHYVDTILTIKENGKPRSALIVSPTWKEIDEVTSYVRDELRGRGVLSGDDVTVLAERLLRDTKAERLNWNRIEKERSHVLTVNGNDLPLKRGRWLIEGREGQMLDLRNMVTGETLKFDYGLFTLKQSERISISERRKMNIAVGERLWIRAQDKELGLRNGMVGIVSRVEADGTIWMRREGKTKELRIPPTFRTFEHGYAFTSHASQGRTVDAAFMAYGYRSKALTRNAFYVSSTRHRTDVWIYTPSLEGKGDEHGLNDWVTQTATRLSARELMNEHHRLRMAEKEFKALAPEVEKEVEAYKKLPPSQKAPKHRRLVRDINRLKMLEREMDKREALEKKIAKLQAEHAKASRPVTGKGNRIEKLIRGVTMAGRVLSLFSDRRQTSLSAGLKVLGEVRDAVIPQPHRGEKVDRAPQLGFYHGHAHEREQPLPPRPGEIDRDLGRGR
ncbi:conjugative relaxase domain-containing protein, TrwC/TraI family [Verrucomicrobium sp. GAS474]|uniref:MobF family relaxase n=1 Tax=Verrucomicrobium sp. GAS474 TaxID=1882831 RepID=UPI00087C32AA|nr:MobF family relaxase [Verrucomicrobium sp. GAS474]SDU13346.1 conjugative relaxase domain-containing protein, TrwC/TraI family [Verrucomicrobium sp. GAS474]